MRIAEPRKSECCPVIGQTEVESPFWDNITSPETEQTSRWCSNSRAFAEPMQEAIANDNSALLLTTARLSSGENAGSCINIELLVGAAGIEPATTGLENRCSIQLSYAPLAKFITSFPWSIMRCRIDFRYSIPAGLHRLDARLGLRPDVSDPLL